MTVTVVTSLSTVNDQVMVHAGSIPAPDPTFATKTHTMFTFVSAFGRKHPFTPRNNEDWEFVHDSTKQNGTAVWADTEEDLRLMWLEHNKADYERDEFVIASTMTGYGNWALLLWFPVSGETYEAHTTNARFIDNWKDDDGNRDEDNAREVRDYVLRSNGRISF